MSAPWLSWDAQVEVVQPCASCGGTGWAYAPYCRQCGTFFRPEELAALVEVDWNRVLPCGHTADQLAEERSCPTCQGDGSLARLVSLRELRALFVTAEREEPEPGS